MEAFALLLGVRSHVFLKFMKMGVKDMHFEGHPATHFAVVCHQGLNKLHIVFGLVIPQEAKNYCNKAVPRCSLCPCEFFGETPCTPLPFYLWPIKTPASTFAADNLGKKSWRYLKAGDSLSRAMTNCFIRPSFKRSGGNSIFWDPTMAPILRCSSPHKTRFAVASHAWGSVTRYPCCFKGKDNKNTW